MSGGRWNYKDQQIVFVIDLNKILDILDILTQCFHHVDWAESSDSSKKEASEKIYDLLLKLGDDLFAV